MEKTSHLFPNYDLAVNRTMTSFVLQSIISLEEWGKRRESVKMASFSLGAMDKKGEQIFDTKKKS